MFLREPNRPRHTPLGRFLHLRVSLVPLRSSRVACHENQVPRLDAFRGDLEPVLRLERNIVLGKHSRFPILADVGAQKTPVSRVPRPSPVVRLPAEYANSVGGRVDQPHVLDLHLCNLEVLQSGEERRHIATLSTLLTRRDALLDPPLDQVVTLAVRRFRVDIPRDRAGDLGDGGSHKDARTRTIRQLVAPGLCQIAVL